MRRLLAHNYAVLFHRARNYCVQIVSAPRKFRSGIPRAGEGPDSDRVEGVAAGWNGRRPDVPCVRGPEFGFDDYYDRLVQKADEKGGDGRAAGAIRALERGDSAFGEHLFCHFVYEHDHDV